MMQEFPNRNGLQFHEQQIGDELLLYNEQTHQASFLNTTAAMVWKQCDGRTSAATMAFTMRTTWHEAVDQSLVELTLRDLERAGLIAGLPAPEPSKMTRRAMIGSVGVRAAMLLPVVAAVMAPTAAQAYTGCFNCSTTSSHSAMDSSAAAPPTSAAPVSKVPAGSVQTTKEAPAFGEMPRIDGTQP